MTAVEQSEPGPAPVFPNYVQMRRRAPIAMWHAVRICSMAAFVGLCVVLVVRPAAGLFVFWRVIVPCLPLLFFLAPGLWRNICPLAAANQTPRLLGLTRGLTAPAWLKERGYLFAIGAFLAIVAARKPVFNTNGPALAILLAAIILAAFTGGLFLKGKSGWCSTLCPLLPVQRLYGQTPFVAVPNSHCQPCVGCTKNCYDFNPHVAYQADMYDSDPRWSAPRTLFAGIFPGLILAFFTVPGPPESSWSEMLLRYGAYVLVGAGSFFALDAVLGVTRSKLAAIYGAVALTIFYWYNSRTIAGAVEEILDRDAGWIVWPLRVAVFGLAVAWVIRSFRVERTFVEQSVGLQAVRLAPSKVRDLSEQGRTGAGAEVHFVPEERRVVVEAGATLLEVAEGDGLPIEAGCRMGMCGSDPVAVHDGMENLSPIGEEEANTLRRLGLATSTRMACCARIQGDVCVSLTPDKADPAQPPPRPATVDPSIRSVVVIGNGIAGITAADFTRRNHPDCEIHVIGQESHPLYNRMGISRLIYGRSAMLGLYLLGDDWYEEHGITCWLNTRAQRIDVEGHKVVLGTGEELAFDRLILAMGCSSLVPPIAGFGRPGSFVLREADDAMRIRAFTQEHGARRAVVAGGGLLGLEAAYALRQLGLRVSVVEQAPRLLARQVDERCSEVLDGYFEGLGIHMVYNAIVASVEGDERVSGTRLSDGTLLECDAFLVCAGIRPNADLAREAGLNVNRGVIVDDRMATGTPGIYAAGDVAELDGQVLGLWPIAVRQAEVAASNAVGGDELHASALPVTILKGVGIDLTSVGRWQMGEGAEGETEEVVVDMPSDHSYGKLMISGGRLVGAILLGRSHDAPHVVAAVKNGVDVSGCMDALRRGEWKALGQRALVGTATTVDPEGPRSCASGAIPSGTAEATGGIKRGLTSMKEPMTDSRDTVRRHVGAENVVEIHEPERTPRRLTVVGAIELGRECEGEVLEDAEVSRRHLRLTGGPGGLTVEDLGSSNGTMLNNHRLLAATPLHAGDVVLLGRTKIVAMGAAAPAPGAAPRETLPPVRSETPAADRPESPAPVHSEPVLTVRDLRKLFGDRAAVDGVSFDIHLGECYGLLGPNGAGKTTTISMLCGLLDRDGGEVTVAGQKLDPGATQAKSAIGYVPQDIALYLDMSARENLQFFGRLYGLSGARLAGRIDATLDAVGLQDRAGDKVGSYSGGMARRINIAVGLLHEPKLLVLDEPTVGVDPQSRNAILEAVEKLGTEGMAVLYTTHYMEEAERLCDRVGIIDEGHIVAEGTRRELVQQVGERDRLRVSASGPLDVFATECLKLDGVERADVTEEGIEVLAQNGQALLVPLVRKAEEVGVKVTGVDVVEPDLEAVFLHLTGKALRD